MREIKHMVPIHHQRVSTQSFSVDALTVFNLGGWDALRSYVDRIPLGVYCCLGDGSNCPCFGAGYLAVTDDEQ